jgi:hypothetical protein
MKKLLLFCLCTLLFLTCNGTNYYFSNTGSDTNIGTSPDQSWKSISKLKQIIPNLQPGDMILFEKGSKWYEVEININSLSGTSANPITFGSYGSGSLPVLSGGILLTNFSQNGNIWSKNNLSYRKTDYINNPAGLLVNNKFYRVAREPDSGYRTTNSSGKTYLEDNDDPGWITDELVGGQVSAKCVNWSWEVFNITGNSSSSISMTGGDQDMGGTTYYFLENVDKGLSQNGEWTFNNNGTLKVFYTSNLNSETIEFPVIDTLFRMDNCEHIQFNDLEFNSANGKIFDIWNGKNIDFKNCSFRVAGTGIEMNFLSDVNFEDNYMEYAHTNGIVMNYISNSSFYNNTFKYTPGIEGMNNNYKHEREGNPKGERWGSAITNYYGDSIYFKYNTFDTLMIAYQTHWSYGPWYFERNLIRDYGWTLGDHGAIYMGGDWQVDFPKIIRKNIILNGNFHEGALDGSHIGGYVHGIYHDYDTRGILADSNTIVNTNGAIYHNRTRHNIARHNKFVNCAKDLNGLWSNDIYMDALIDGNEGDPTYNTFEYNTHVFGNNQNEVAVSYHGGSSYPFSFNTMSIDHNIYQDPYTYDSGGDNTHRELYDYSVSFKGNINQMNSRRGYDANSVFNPLNHTFDDVSGIAEDNFVKVVFNTSLSPNNIPLEHSYVDFDNQEFSGSVHLLPYESRILFYKEASGINQSVVIHSNNNSITENEQIGLQFEIKRDQTLGNLHVIYSTSGTLTPDDYQETLTDTITIFDGDSTAYINISPVNDTLCESNETITITLQSGVDYALGSSTSAQGTIMDDDVCYSIERIEVEENYSILNDEGSNGDIFSNACSDMISGQMVALQDMNDEIRVSLPVNDAGNYTLKIRLRAGWNGDEDGFWPDKYSFKLDGTPITLTGDTSTISNLDTGCWDVHWGTMKSSQVNLPSGLHYLDIKTNRDWAQVDYIELESQSSDQIPIVNLQSLINQVAEDTTSGLQFELKRDQTLGNLHVIYSTSGTLTPDDYQETLTDTITIFDGDSTAYINISPVNDTLCESNETITITLQSGVDYALGSSTSAQGTIMDDDVCYSIERIEVEENYSILNDEGSNGDIFSNACSDMISGQMVALQDMNDEIRVSLPVNDAGNYVLRTGLRSGWSGNNQSYWPDKYLFKLDGTPISFEGDTTSISTLDSGCWEAYWGEMNTNTVSLSQGNHNLDIKTNQSYAYVDYVELIPIYSQKRFTSDSESTENSSVFRIYPNPFTDILIIDNDREVQKIEIYDLLGSLKLSKRTNTENAVTIETDFFKNGVYIIRITDKFGKTYTKKVVK